LRRGGPATQQVLRWDGLPTSGTGPQLFQQFALQAAGLGEARRQVGLIGLMPAGTIDGLVLTHAFVFPRARPTCRRRRTFGPTLSQNCQPTIASSVAAGATVPTSVGAPERASSTPVGASLKHPISGKGSCGSATGVNGSAVLSS